MSIVAGAAFALLVVALVCSFVIVFGTKTPAEAIYSQVGGGAFVIMLVLLLGASVFTAFS